MIRNTKVIGNEECVSHHKLLVCNMKFQNPSVSIAESNNGEHNIDNSWHKIKEAFLKAADNICDLTKGGTRRQHELWWWDNNVARAVKQKQKLWKEWLKRRVGKQMPI